MNNTKNVPEIRFKGCYDEDGNWVAFTHPWEQRKVLDLLIQPITDGPHETPKLVEKGVPFISVDAIVDNKIDFNRKRGNISEEYDELCCKKYKPQFHDVYLVKSGSTVGKVAIVETTDRFNIWSPLAAMRCGEKTYPYFLYDLLQTKDLQAQVADKASNGTQPNLSMRELEKFPVSVPSNLEEQKKIGDYFRSLDHLITLHQRKANAYKKLKKGMLQKLLNQVLRFKADDGSDFPDWEEKKLGDVFKISTETNGDKYSKRDVLSVSDEYGIVNQIKLQGRSFAGNDISKYKVVKTGQLVYTRSPLAVKPFGIIKIVGEEIGIVSPLYIVNDVRENNCSKFWYYNFDTPERTNDYLKPLVRMGAKHTMNISNEEWLSGKVMVPCFAEQQKIADYFSSLDNVIESEKVTASVLKKFKKGMLQKMFV